MCETARAALGLAGFEVGCMSCRVIGEARGVDVYRTMVSQECSAGRSKIGAWCSVVKREEASKGWAEWVRCRWRLERVCPHAWPGTAAHTGHRRRYPLIITHLQPTCRSRDRSW